MTPAQPNKPIRKRVTEAVARNHAKREVATAKTLRSSEWVGEAPPTTPDCEGWWWWKYRVVGAWTPGRVFRAFGRLNIEVTEDWAPSVAERDHQVIWGGRCVEPGASPTVGISDRTNVEKPL